jgi:hypothetical protein
MLADNFNQIYLFVIRLAESLQANLITSSMVEAYALVAIDVFKIIVLAAKYARLGYGMLDIVIRSECRILLEGYV